MWPKLSAEKVQRNSVMFVLVLSPWCGRPKNKWIIWIFGYSDGITTISPYVATFYGRKCAVEHVRCEGMILSNWMLELVSNWKTKSKASNQTVAIRLLHVWNDYMETVIVDVWRCIAQSNNCSIHWSGAHLTFIGPFGHFHFDRFNELSDWSFQHLSIVVFINEFEKRMTCRTRWEAIQEIISAAGCITNIVRHFAYSFQPLFYKP